MYSQTLQVFKETTHEFIMLIEKLDEKSLNQIPKHGGWSPGQIGDHVLRSYASAETMNGRTEISDRPADEKIAQVKELFLNFSIQMDSPKEIVPTNASIDKITLVKKLKDRVWQFVEIIKTADLSMVCLDFAIPEYGSFTGLEWAWFNIFHTQRHIHQLKNTIKDIG